MQLHLLRRKPTSKNRRLIKTILGLATASAMLITAPAALACDSCDSGPVGCDSCSSGRSIPSPGKVVYKTLDAFAGSIEKVLGLDKCKSSGCDSGACDGGGCDGCDAVMMEELMMPSPPVHSTDIHTQPRMIHRGTPVPAPHVVPAPIHEPLPRSVPAPRMAPRSVPAPVPHVEPITDSDAAPAMVAPAEPYQELPSKTEREQYEDYNAMPDESNKAPETETPLEPVPETTPDTPTEVPEIKIPDELPPAKRPETKKEGGSLFDALDDPFKDDEATLPQPYRTIRPSNYRSTKQPNGMLLNSPQARTAPRNTTHQHLYNNSRAGSLPYRTTNTHTTSQSVNAQRRSIASQKAIAIRSRSTTQRVYTQAPSRAVSQTARSQYSHRQTRIPGNAYHTTTRPATSARQVSHDVQRGAQSSASKRYHSQRSAKSQASQHQNPSQLRQYQHVQPRLKPAPRSSRGQRHSNASY